MGDSVSTALHGFQQGQDAGLATDSPGVAGASRFDIRHGVIPKKHGSIVPYTLFEVA